MALWGGLAGGLAEGSNKIGQLRRQQQQFQQQQDYRNQVFGESTRQFQQQQDYRNNVLSESMRSARAGEKLQALQIQSQLLGKLGGSSGASPASSGGTRDPDHLKRYLESVPQIAQRDLYGKLHHGTNVGPDWIGEQPITPLEFHGLITDYGNARASDYRQRGLVPGTGAYNQAMQDSYNASVMPSKGDGKHDQRHWKRIMQLKPAGVDSSTWGAMVYKSYLGQVKATDPAWTNMFMGQVEGAVQGMPSGGDVQQRQEVRSKNQSNTLDKIRRIEKEKGFFGSLLDRDYRESIWGHIGRTLIDTPSRLADRISQIPGGKALVGHGPPPGAPPPPVKQHTPSYQSQQDYNQRSQDELIAFQQSLQGKTRNELFAMIQNYPYGSTQRQMVMEAINVQILDEAGGFIGQ